MHLLTQSLSIPYRTYTEQIQFPTAHNRTHTMKEGDVNLCSFSSISFTVLLYFAFDLGLYSREEWGGRKDGRRCKLVQGTNRGDGFIFTPLKSYMFFVTEKMQRHIEDCIILHWRCIIYQMCAVRGRITVQWQRFLVCKLLPHTANISHINRLDICFSIGFFI